MDVVVRTSYSPELEARVASMADETQELSEIHDRFYRPAGTDLSEFSPRDIIVRKREFPDKKTLVKINIIPKPTGYTDTKESLDSLDGYQQWGDFSSCAVEYTIPIEGTTVRVLIEQFSFGNYVKIEAPSLTVLQQVITDFDLDDSDLIEKNSAELLAENMALI